MFKKMVAKNAVLLTFVSVISMNAFASGDDEFSDYSMRMYTDSNKAHTQTFRLPTAKADSFLKMFADASEHLNGCTAFSATSNNPLIRRDLSIGVEPLVGGVCSVQIRDYGGDFYLCSLSASQTQQLSSIWAVNSKGQGLGSRSSDEQILLNELCDISRVDSGNNNR